MYEISGETISKVANELATGNNGQPIGVEDLFSEETFKELSVAFSRVAAYGLVSGENPVSLMFFFFLLGTTLGLKIGEQGLTEFNGTVH